jgi:hypothetical protein
MRSNFDANIENYTLSELMAISNIKDLDDVEINEKTDILINKFKNTDAIISNFFAEVKSQLLQYSNSLEPNDKDDDFYEDAEYPVGDIQTKKWIENSVLPQENTIQSNKITDRKQQIDVYGNDHVPINKKQLGISNTFNVPIVQDTLNPTLKNTISRVVNLDSQFRQYSGGVESTSTDYTLDLSDPLSNVLSIRLYSYQIPYSWYTIDTDYGNTCFWINDVDSDTNIVIKIESGNYNPSNFVNALNLEINNNFTGLTTPVSYNDINGKITMNLIGGISIASPFFTISSATIIKFFDINIQCQTTCINNSNYLNQTLGWLMGFRLPFVNANANGNTAPSLVDLNGPKYLILVLDDYNQNHVNNGLVSITEYSNNLKLPSYFSPDIPYICFPANTNNIETLIDLPRINQSNGLLIAGKLNVEYKKTQEMIASAPRTLTQAQLYTINEINKNRNNNTNFRAKAPTSTDILSILPIKNNNINTGSLLVEFGGTLQDNIRTYFGPVNIERMHVKLQDDKGNLLNLNGSDWCITLICECLYQY